MSRAHVVGFLLMVGAPQLGAQAVRPDSAVHGHLFNAEAARIAAYTGVGAVVIMPADPFITKLLRAASLQRNQGLQNAASDFDRLGDPGTVIVAASLYGVGRLARRPEFAEMGLRSAEALLISGVTTGLIKGVMGRDRPFLDEGDSDDFRAGGGFRGSGHTSFPSGHATAAFAVAAVVASESNYHWPRAGRFVAPAMYGLASFVGLARVYGAHHWASDIVAGAGIGTLTGISVVRYHHLHPDTRFDRWLLGTRIVPVVANGSAGLAVTASF